MVEKLYNTKFIVANMTKIVANDNQLHSDWLQKIEFLVVNVVYDICKAMHSTMW
jgi:hypothetical protein